MLVQLVAANGVSDFASHASREIEARRRIAVDVQTLTSFFMWCTILNGGLLILLVLLFKSAPDLIYRTQKFWCPLSRETFDVVLYGYLGIFKIFFLMFNAVPYVALLIIG